MLTLLLTTLLVAADPQPHDLLIREVMIHDGTGKPGYVGDIAIAGNKIVAIGKVMPIGRPRIVDGKGLIAAPGFIDLHTHCDTGSPSIADEKGRDNDCYLFQGVTLVVTGNCGMGPTDVKEFFAKLDKNGVGTHVIHQVPHNSIRTKVMGNANRGPTAEELVKLEELVEQQMKDGCWGLSTGLIYTPGTYAKTPEIIALAKVAARHHGFYASHIRNENTGLLDAVNEAIAIGREAKLPVHISHIKCSGKNAWGQAGQALALIEKARRDGQAITADQYPYTASSTSMAATVIPTRFREGTAKEYLARLADPEQAAAIRKAVENALKARGDGRTLQVARYKPKPEWQGKTIARIAETEKRAPIDIIMEIEANGGAAVVNFGMNEEDVRVYMKQPFVATASDGSSQIPGDTVPHPRSYGTFPRKIGKYAIDDGVVKLEDAIRSASGLPADILNLKDRGYLKEGNIADVVIFDPKTFRDTATFDKPHQLATGMRYVIVDGKLAIDAGKRTAVNAGKAMRHP